MTLFTLESDRKKLGLLIKKRQCDVSHLHRSHKTSGAIFSKFPRLIFFNGLLMQAMRLLLLRHNSATPIR